MEGTRVSGRKPDVGLELGFTSSAFTVERSATATIAERFEGRRRPVARSIYVALVELATAGSRVEQTRAVVADYAGVTRKALDEYAPLLEEAGLLRREPRSDESGRSAPNVWVILRGPVQGGHSEGEGHADVPAQSSSPTSMDVEVKTVGGTQGAPTRAGASGVVALPGVGGALDAVASMVPVEMLEDARELVRRKTRVDGKVATEVEVARAAAALAEFNRQAGSDFGLGAHLRPVVMRIRERPGYGEDALVRLVQSAWRIRWWEKNGRGRRGRPSPAVVFGNTQCFENVVQDAVDERQGREREQSRSGRYTRED